MLHSSKFFIGGALLLITISGCAGNGLRNMFSSNESEGYKTLEELEKDWLRLARRMNLLKQSAPAVPAP